MKSWTAILSLIGVLVATGAVAQSTGQTPSQLAAQVGATYKDKSYFRATVSLADEGFYPIKLPHSRLAWPCRTGLCDRYPEVIECSGSGITYCWHVWAGPDHSGYFLVETYGEERLSFNRIRAMRRGEIDKILKGLREVNARVLVNPRDGWAPDWPGF